MLKKYFFLLCLVSFNLYGQIQISNGRLSVVVDPRFGGKITKLSAGQIQIKLSPKDIQKVSMGLAKERLFGDSHDFIISRAKVIKKTSNSITMKIRGKKPPFNRIELEKSISIPASENHIKVELIFRNLSPLEGRLPIVPWIHNSWKPDESETFLIPHSDGFSVTKIQPLVTRQISTAAAGNWSGVLMAKPNTALLFYAETQPFIFYDYLSKKTSSVEMLYKRTNSIPKVSLTYYILPSENWGKRILDLKEKLFPQIPDVLRHSPAKHLDFVEKFTRIQTKDSPMFDVAYCLPEMFISSDIPLPIPWKVLKRDSGEGIIEIELSKDVMLKAGCGGFMDVINNRMEQLSCSKAGEKRIYRFRIHVRPSSQWNPSAIRIFLQSRSVNYAGKLLYRVYYNGKKLSENELTLKSVQIPKAKVPKRFTTIFGADYMLLKTFPKLTDVLKHMGVNGICFYPSIYGANLAPGSIKKMLKLLKQKSFMTAFVSGSCYFNPMVESKPQLQTMDAKGKRMSHLFDFSARGSWMDTLADNFQKWGGTDGVDLIISDYEPYFSGETVGFTPNAIEKFRNYMSQKYPKVKWVSPLTFAQKPGKYLVQEKLWTKFKSSQFTDFLKTITEKVNKLNPKLKIGMCTIPGSSEESMIMANLCDQRKFCRFLDFNMPMLYNNEYKTMSDYRNSIELFKHISAASKGKSKIFPTLTAGLWGVSNPIQPAASTFHILLETAFAQLPGCYIFPGFAGADALPISQMSRALNIIAKYEDIIFEGNLLDDAVWLSDIKNTELKLPAFFKPRMIIHKSKALVYFAEYSPYPISFKAKFQLPGRFTAKDILSGKSYGTLENGSTLDLKLSPGSKAILLELNAQSGVSFPVNFIPVKQLSPDTQKISRKNQILHESFDGTTTGRAAVASHSFSFSKNGLKNHCLIFKDYQAVWLRDVGTLLKSGNLTCQFYFRPSRNVISGSKINYALSKFVFNDNQILRLYFQTGTQGHLGIATGSIEPKRIRWKEVRRGKSDRWAKDKWYKLKVSIGANGVKLWIDDKVEFESKTSYNINLLKAIYLGSEWGSFGSFDELTIFDRSDI